MNRLSPAQHKIRAVLFLVIGAAFAIALAVGMHFDTKRKMVWLWALLALAIIPAIGWGAAHLAQSRGYSSAAGCGVCIIGYVVSGFLGTTSPHPLALGIGALFIVLLPTTVLLAMPDKSERSHRNRRR